MHSWRFGSINIRTGSQGDEGYKMYSITKEVVKSKLDLCCLQEVRYRNQGNKVITANTGESFVFYWCGQKKRRNAGVGVLIKKCKEVHFDEPDIRDPRIMAMNIQVKGFSIRLVNVYSPTNCDGSESQKDTFYRLLKKACVKQHKHQKILVCGDFNATTGVSLRQSFYDGKQVIEDPICNDNGLRLKRFIREKGMCMTQTYFNHPVEERFTWNSPNKITKKVIDYVITEPFVQQYVKECAVCPDFTCDSDHRALITTMLTPTTRRARWKPKTIKIPTKPDPKSLSKIDVQRRFVQALSQEMTRYGQMDQIGDINTKIVKCLNSVAKSTLPKMSKKRKTKEIWKDDEQLNHLTERRQEYQQSCNEYKEITKLIKRRVSFLKNEKMAKEAREINEHANRRQIEQLYTSFKSENTSFKEHKVSKKCDPTKLSEYFRKHFTAVPIDEDPIELENAPKFLDSLQSIPAEEIKTGPPDENELMDVIKRLKDGKSTNDTQSTFIKHALKCNEFKSEIIRLYTTIWETKACPKEWGHSKLVTIWKGPTKGKPDDPSTYRGLQIGSTLCKIMVVIIINRLKSWYEKQLLDQQQGFRAARGTADGIYIAKSIQQITNKMGKPTYLLFVDLSAAFDHVDRKWLFQTIQKRLPIQFDTQLIQLMESLYSNTTTSLAETPDDIFPLNVGVRQGGAESPMLYNLFMDFVMRVYMSRCNDDNEVNFLKLKYKIPEIASSTGRTAKGEMKVDWCGYADDLLLVFNDEPSLCKGITLLDETFTKYKLSINITKTKTMILNQHLEGREYPKSIAKLRGKELENVKCYKYLGCEIKFDEPTTGLTELNTRIDAAECKFYSLAKNMFNRRIKLKTRTLMLNSLVRSRIIYSCQTWSLTKAQLDRMNAQYMLFIRKMTTGGFKRKENGMAFAYTNKDLLKIAGTTDLPQYIKEQQCKYICKVVRKDNTSIVKRLLFNDNPATKPGPKSTLLTSVLASEKCTPEQLYQKAINRE